MIIYSSLDEEKMQDNLTQKELKQILSDAFDEDSRNIPRELKRRAMHETCDFICSNMSFVPFNFKDAKELLTFALKKIGSEGLCLEFGVYTGSSIRDISSIVKREVFGFDSFEGLPETWRPDFPKGTFKTEKLPMIPKDVILIKGHFDQTLPEFTKTHPEPVSFMHIDCDLYSSAKTIFDNFILQITKGTVIVFDEYFNYPMWKNNEFKAFNEFIEKSNKNFEYLGYVYNHSQVAIRII